LTIDDFRFPIVALKKKKNRAQRQVGRNRRGEPREWDEKEMPKGKAVPSRLGHRLSHPAGDKSADRGGRD
jgi:hypothetical protein